MANINKVIWIGRLTRDPESKTFANGGKVTQFSLAVSNRKKGSDGQWQDDPCYLDCKAFNRQHGAQLADLCENSLRKGHQVYVEGHLVREVWQSQEGQQRSALKLYVDQLQFLEKREQGGQASAAPARPRDTSAAAYADPEGDASEEIPF